MATTRHAYKDNRDYEAFIAKMRQLVGGIPGNPAAQSKRHVHPHHPPGFCAFNLSDKEMELKKQYKQSASQPGIYTEHRLDVLKDTAMVARAREKLSANKLIGQNYNVDEASFKLHVGINGLPDMDEKVVNGLIEFLIKESEKPSNASFHFKIANPDSRFVQTGERFYNHDQFTIYFDKYSSIADVIRITQNIQAYIKQQGIDENKIPFGMKDKFGFNSFVTARWDSNKLHGEYGLYTFFDLELEKFIKRHNIADFEKVPLCALEAVFFKVLASDAIKDLTAESDSVNPESSRLIQAEFERMLKNPMEYMKPAAANPSEEVKVLNQLQNLLDNLEKINTDFSKFKSAGEVDNYLKEQKVFFDRFRQDSEFRKLCLKYSPDEYMRLQGKCLGVEKELRDKASERKVVLEGPASPQQGAAKAPEHKPPAATPQQGVGLKDVMKKLQLKDLNPSSPSDIEQKILRAQQRGEPKPIDPKVKVEDLNLSVPSDIQQKVLRAQQKREPSPVQPQPVELKPAVAEQKINVKMTPSVPQSGGKNASIFMKFPNKEAALAFLKCLTKDSPITEANLKKCYQFVAGDDTTLQFRATYSVVDKTSERDLAKYGPVPGEQYHQWKLAIPDAVVQKNWQEFIGEKDLFYKQSEGKPKIEKDFQPIAAEPAARGGLKM